MKIITSVVNNPTFIEIQYHTFKKYLKLSKGNGEGEGDGDEFEFIVFNDAKPFADYSNDGDITLRTKIADTCSRLNIQCIMVPNEHHINLVHRHEDVFNKHILSYQLANPDKYLLVDSDMFLIDYLYLDNTYFNYSCALVLQSRIEYQLNYIWPGICYLDFTKIKEPTLFNWAQGRGGDVGGMTEEWLKLQLASEGGGGVMPKTDDLRWKKNQTFHTDSIYFIKHLWSCSWNESEMPDNLKSLDNYNELLTFFKEDVRNVNNNFYCEIYDNVFLHYRAGGNWNKEGMDLHNKLTERLKNILVRDM